MASRFASVTLDEDQQHRAAAIYRAAEKFEEQLEDLYPAESRYKALAMTKLEEAVMWAVKGVSRE